MTVSAAAAREWRQFQLLSRDSVRRLINSAVLSQDADPIQFALWVTALAATPPAMFAFSRMFEYSILGRVDTPVHVLEAVVLAHRMFFVVYAMAASALLAAVLWETLLPDRIDQEIVGALPVRPRTMAAARLAAAVAIVLAFAGAISIPSGLLFVVISATTPLLGFPPLVFVAHVSATMAGCLFVFLALLIVRGAVATGLGAGVADRLATVLQLVAVFVLVEVLFYLPAVLPRLVQQMFAGDPLAMMLPPVWYAALYSWIAGLERTALAGLAGSGVLALLCATAVVIPLYLLPARMMARRALESQSRQRAGALATVSRAVSAILTTTPAVRSIIQFTLASLVRSRRHLLIVMSYAGVAIAIALVGLISAGLRGTAAVAQPTGYLLMLPLVLIFFLVFGVRAACAVPTDLEANWPFRLSPPSVMHAIAAMRLTLLVLAIVPVVALGAAGALMAGWPVATVISVSGFDLVAGLLLVECALVGWRKVPFACAHTPAPDTLRSRWLVFAVPFIAFAIVGAGVQLAALRSPAGTMIYAGSVIAAVVAVRTWSGRQAARHTVEFDLPPHGELQFLNLSEALR